jgi:hypothetical protein
MQLEKIIEQIIGCAYRALRKWDSVFSNPFMKN